MNLLSPTPFWPIRDGLPCNYPTLHRNISCDVAILGGGISGGLAALHLTEAGLDVVVLDRRDVGHGSTAGSTSLLQYEIDEPLHRLAQRYGTDHAQRSYLRCRDAIDSIAALVTRLKIDCGFQRKHSLLLASQRSHLPRLKREFEARQTAGFKVAWWNASKIAANSTLRHLAGILSDEGGQLDAYRFTHGLLAAASAAGASIFDRTAVTQNTSKPNGTVLRTKDDYSVKARHLVIATGYEADAMLPQRLTHLQSTFALISEPVGTFAGWPSKRCLIWETADPYIYLRSTEDDRIIIGGYDEEFRNPTERDSLLASKTALLKRRFRQLFPKIPIEVAYSWAGTFARTPDGLPYIGRRPSHSHTWFALGYGGNGITFSLIAAESIRDQILGRESRDVALFGFGRKQLAAGK